MDRIPDKLSLEAALAALDVCNAAFQTRSLIDGATRTVLVLGGGHAGLLALAAARDSLPAAARAILIDADEHICRGPGIWSCASCAPARPA